MTAHAVELHDVFCVHRSNQGDAAALQGINVTLAEGELLCVLGPSGAGKSTLLRVIAGLQLPQAGVVAVLGRDIGRLTARTRARLRHERLGFLSQHSEAALPPDLPARSAIGLPLALRGVRRAPRAARVAELLEASGLEERADARPGELSGGERQRLALCVALAQRPALLLADEPTGELDAVAADTVRRLIAELVRREGASAIVVSHDQAIGAVADRVIEMRDGRVVEEGRDRDRALVVDDRGWLRLSDDMRGAAGIGGLAHARPATGGLILTAAGVRAQPAASVVRGPRSRRPNRAASLELRAVARSYSQGRSERRVLDRVTHAFIPGRLTVIAGPSGAGKTTILRLLAGIDRPDSGEVLLDGRSLAPLDLEQLAALRRERIGYLPQEPSPVGFLSALENLVLVLRLRGWDEQRAAARAEHVLAQVGLAERARQRVSRLSAGESQRVALARALASARGLLILDEPTSRLDQLNAHVVAQLIGAAAAEGGNTVICATHDPLLIGRADALIELGASSETAAAARQPAGLRGPSSG